MLGRNRVQAESRQGTEGMQGSEGTGTGHTGTHRAIRTRTGHSGVQAGLMQGAGAPSWQLPPLLQQDGMARLAPSPRDCSVPGLSSGLPPPQGSTLGHTPTLTVWGNKDQGETCGFCPGLRKPVIDSVHRKAQNSYKSTNFYSPAPGWLMSSLVLAAQQAGKGEPPCL